MMEPVFTIGHSNHTKDQFIALLRQHGVTALCDVRSIPYSRVNPQFNRETLKQALKQNGIAYVFLGKELGGRSEDPSCYIHGKVQYDLLARTELFQKGIERLREGLKQYRLALMCAERDPIECHRTILVARQLDALGIPVEHILGDSSLESHQHTLGRLLRQIKSPGFDMFRSEKEVIQDAYRIQGDRIAYKEDPGSPYHAKPERNTVG
jgi:uncharacterized protein (DUF488 family)